MLWQHVSPNHFHVCAHSSAPLAPQDVLRSPSKAQEGSSQLLRVLRMCYFLKLEIPEAFYGILTLPEQRTNLQWIM